jgi:hypothetical protein
LAAAFARELYLPAITLETNGIGGFLPGLLRAELAKAGMAVSVIEVASWRNKDVRIVEAFDAPLADRQLHAHASVFETPFIAEMREWRPGGKFRDDGLDAVSGCLLSEPVRLTRWAAPAILHARIPWRPGGRSFRAGSEFEV